MKKNFSIEIRQEYKRYKISHARVKGLTQKLLKILKIKSAELDILLVSDRMSRKMNRELMKHDWATDVITIGSIVHSAERKELKNLCPLPSALCGLSGNILISLDTTARQAKEYGNDFLYELMFYICHGILHLLGWDDNTKVKRDKMLAKQSQILKKLNLKIAYRS